MILQSTRNTPNSFILCEIVEDTECSKFGTQEHSRRRCCTSWSRVRNASKCPYAFARCQCHDFRASALNVGTHPCICPVYLHQKSSRCINPRTFVHDVACCEIQHRPNHPLISVCNKSKLVIQLLDLPRHHQITVLPDNTMVFFC